MRVSALCRVSWVSTHSRPKAAGAQTHLDLTANVFQHTAARRRLAWVKVAYDKEVTVSTHSRPKAAGIKADLPKCDPSGFNTQPPEGGWVTNSTVKEASKGFQHTAARRRLATMSV